MSGVLMVAVAITVAGPLVIAGLSRCTGVLVVFVAVAFPWPRGRSLHHRRGVFHHKRLIYYGWLFHHWWSVHAPRRIHKRPAVPNPRRSPQPGGMQNPARCHNPPPSPPLQSSLD